MPRRRQKRWLAGLGAALGGCLVGAGCHTTPLTSACTPATLDRQPTVRLAGAELRPDPATYRLGPQTVLQWTITPGKGQADPGLTGKSVVNAEGQIDMGPYGSVSVGGLTTKQASDTIARHLARYLPGAKVHLAALVPASLPARMEPPPTQHEPIVTRTEPPMVRTTERALASLLPPRATVSQTNDVSPTGWRNTPAGKQAVTSAALEIPAPMPAGPSEPAPGAKPPAKPSSDKPLTDDKAPAGNVAGENQGTGEILVPPGPPPEMHAGTHTGHAPNELAKVALPPYVVEPPDILLVEYVAKAEGLYLDQAVQGQHLIRPDGTINLGIYGTVAVGGLTLEQARAVIATKLSERLKDVDPTKVVVDVLAYNSKVYYVITDGAGYGEQVFSFPVTGSETVLDAMAKIQGLPPQSSKKHIWVARRSPGYTHTQILPVDWIAMTQGGIAATNYQVMPGDRIYVQADKWRTFDTGVAKVLSPFERILGFTLLGSETVSSVRTASGSSGSRGTATGR